VKQFLSVVLKKQADTLVRLTGLCYRRGVPIESLSYVTETENGTVRIMAVLDCGRPTAEQLRRQVSNLVNVVGASLSDSALTPH
jgi:acetolactate synthase small subunit